MNAPAAALALSPPPLFTPRAWAALLAFVLADPHFFVPDYDPAKMQELYNLTPWVVLGSTLLGLVFSLFLPPGWISSLIGLLAGGGMLFAIAEVYYRVRGHEGLGMGDVKMLAMIGAFLGWQLMLLTLVLASFAGSVVGVALLASRRGGMQAALPFGTFLSLGAIVAAVAGDAILAWYLSFY